jgi:ABC-type branched-subunit amino acid transport system permease subunit
MATPPSHQSTSAKTASVADILSKISRLFATARQRWFAFFADTKLGPFPLAWYFSKWRAGIIWLVIALSLPQILGVLSSINPDVFPQQSLLATFIAIGIYVLLALGLNIVVGYAGLLDLGYVAFFVLGSYAAAAGTGGLIANGNGSPVEISKISFWWMILIGAFIAGVFGVILGAPTLRLRGDYLAIVTLGFGEIVPIAFTNIPFFFGSFGITAVPPPPVDTPFGQFDLSNVLDRSAFYYLIIIVIAVIILFVVALRESSLGRAWIAIREDEVAASAAGINLVSVKLAAFGLGATIGGLAGVLNATYISSVDPHNFNFSVSISILLMVVLGGIGSIPGVILGASLLTFFNVFLLGKVNDAIHTSPLVQPTGSPLHGLVNFDFNTTKFLLYGLLLLIMILLRPQGLLPNRRRQREMQGIGIAAESLSVVGEIIREEYGEGDEPVIAEVAHE